MATENINIWMRLKGAAQANAQTKQLNASLGSMIGKYGSLAAAGAGVVAFYKSTVSAQIEQDKIFRRLSTSIKLAGTDYKSVEKNLLGYFDALQRTTEFGDTDSAQALQTLTTLTGDYNKALKSLPLALDVAATGMFDLNTAARMVGQAAAGAPEIWGRYIAELKSNANPELKNLKTGAEKAEYALKVLNEKFGGTAQENVESYAGKIAQLNNRLGDVQEKFGDVFLKLLDSTGAMDLTQKAIDNVNDSWWNLSPIVNLFNTLIGDSEKNLVELDSALDNSTNSSKNNSDQVDETTKKYKDFRDELIKTIEQREQEAWWTHLVNLELGNVEPIERNIDGYKKLQAEIKETEKPILSLMDVTEESSKNIKTNSLNALMQYKDGINEIAYRAGAFFAEHTAASKAALITQATMDTYAGANRALGAFPPPWSFIAAASVVAMGLANVAKIAGFQTGGSFIVPGSGGVDNQTVAFKASPGERVTVETPEMESSKGVTIIFNNPIMDQRFTEQKIIPMIKKAMAKGIQ